MPCLRCCRSAVEDALKGFAVLTALGGLAVLLGGLHALLPLGAAATDGVAWFAWCLVVFGGLLLALGAAAATGSWCSLAAPMHCVSGRMCAWAAWLHSALCYCLQVPLMAPDCAPAASARRPPPRSTPAPPWRCCRCKACWPGRARSTPASCAAWRTATKPTACRPSWIGATPTAAWRRAWPACGSCCRRQRRRWAACMRAALRGGRRTPGEPRPARSAPRLLPALLPSALACWLARPTPTHTTCLPRRPAGTAGAGMRRAATRCCRGRPAPARPATTPRPPASRAPTPRPRATPPAGP